MIYKQKDMNAVYSVYIYSTSLHHITQYLPDTTACFIYNLLQ